MTVMITRHKIINFKSFREAEIKLNDFNLLIGRNGAGKTNLVQSLDFLAHVIRDKNLSKARQHLNVTAIDSVTNASVHSSIFSFEIDLETEDGVLLYKIELEELDDAGKSLRVVSESLRTKQGKDIFTRSGNIVTNEEGKNIPLSVEDKDLAISLFKEGRANEFRKEISQLFLSNNIDFEHRDFSSSDPKHLPHILNLLYEKESDDYSKFETVAKKIIPTFNGFSAFDLGESSGKNESLLFLLRQVKSESVFSAYASSTGDMKTLYILAVLFAKAKNSTLIIEEIENGLHPERLKILLEHVHRIAHKRDVQLIITTHSPSVIDVTSPNQIQFLYVSDDGSSKIQQVTQYMTEDIRKILDEGGDLSDYLKMLTS